MKSKITGFILLLSLVAVQSNSQLRVDTVLVTNATTCSACNGSATAYLTGGTAPYTYSWSNGQTTQTSTGLCPGNTFLLVVYDSLGNIARSNYFTIGPQPASLGLFPSNTSCGSNTGSVLVYVFGGTSPFTYSWSPGGETTSSISGLSLGTYSVTVTDIYGCNTTASAVISGTLQITVATSSELCFGGNSGSVSVTNVSGGVSPYTYSWSPSGNTNSGVSNLSAGYYTVTVTDSNGCNSSALDSIEQPYPVYIEPGLVIGATCSNNDGIIKDTSVFGGTPPYTYSWSLSGETTEIATGLASGTYTLTVTDINGCTGTISSVVPFTGLFPTISSGNDSCYGESNGLAVVTSVSGGVLPYTYSWIPSGNTTSSVNGLSAGNYSVTITDNNSCSTTRDVIIEQPSLLTFIVDTMPDTGSCSGSATIRGSGGMGPYTFSWSLVVITTNDSIYPDSVQIDSLCYGTYWACITDANGCISCDSVHIRHGVLVTGVSTIKKNTGEIKIYPDPASYRLFLATDGMEQGTCNLFIYDMIGRQMQQYNNITISPGQTIPLDVSGLSTGKYMLRISGEEFSKTIPFMVIH